MSLIKTERTIIERNKKYNLVEVRSPEGQLIDRQLKSIEPRGIFLKPRWVRDMEAHTEGRLLNREVLGGVSG